MASQTKGTDRPAEPLGEMVEVLTLFVSVRALWCWVSVAKFEREDTWGVGHKRATSPQAGPLPFNPFGIFIGIEQAPPASGALLFKPGRTGTLISFLFSFCAPGRLTMVANVVLCRRILNTSL